MTTSAVVANQLECEAGRIMMTQGLSTSEMNGLLVELESQRNIGTENFRWVCLFLVTQTKNSIRPVNLTQPVAPTAQESEIVDKLVEEHGDFIESGEFDKAQEKLLLALSKIPYSGYLHQLLGEVSNRMNNDLAVTIKHMRRAVANPDPCSSSAEDIDRLFPARISYSAVLGRSGDLNGEQAQLEKLLQLPDPPTARRNMIPTIMIIYAESLRIGGKYDACGAILRQLESMPRPFPSNVNFHFNIESQLKHNKAKLSNELYELALASEKRADDNCYMTDSDKRGLLKQSKTLLTQSITILNDAAAFTAYERVCRKLNPDEDVTINGFRLKRLPGGLTSAEPIAD